MISATSQFFQAGTRATAGLSVRPQVDMGRVASIVLGGGQGTRLFPLTATRCKPAISFGGSYCLIDVALSNAINSHCQKIFVVTQFLSASLHRHIFSTYFPKAFSSGFIELLAADQRPNKESSWYEGTADAVRKNIDYFIETPADYFLILSGDQLYHMDFSKMLAFALEKEADLVIASLPVNQRDAKRMGLLKVNSRSEVVDFYEKPQEEEILDCFKCPETILENLCKEECEDEQYLGSMGIYLLKREVLLRLLEEDRREDFGKHLIPYKVSQGGVYAYLYEGYWEDIGTIESFYKANMSLTNREPPFNIYDDQNPVYRVRHNLPGPKIYAGIITQSVIGEGSIIDAKEISHSILGPRTVVHRNSVIRDSYVMGNDFYTSPVQATSHIPEMMHIGKDTVIEKAIIDNNVCIGNNVRLLNQNNLFYYDSEQVFIRDGIILVKRGAHLPDGYTL